MKKDLLVLLVSILLFAGLSLYQINLPGLYYDEAADAVPAMQVLYGQKVDLVHDAGIWIGDRAFPIMTMDYVGTVNTYLLLPLFAFLGVSTFSLRLLTILASAAAIVTTYFLVKGLFNRPTAAISIILLATHPSFVFWSRQGIHVTSIMVFFAIAGLFLLLRWFRGKGTANLYLASFLLGTGISAKLLFIWYPVSFAISYFVFFSKEILKTLGLARNIEIASSKLSFVSFPFAAETGRFGSAHSQISGHDSNRINPRHPTLFQAIISLLLLILGSWMILLYNLETQGTIATLQRNLVNTDYGVNNLDFLANLATRLDALVALLHGGNFWYLGGPFSFGLYPVIFFISVPGSLVLTIRSPFSRFRRPTAFIILSSLLVILQSIVTVSGLWPTHYFTLLPLLQIPIAVFVFLLYQRLKPKIVAGLIFLSLVGLMLGGNLYTDFLYHNSLSQNGGLLTHSDAIYGLSDYLEQRGIEKPIAMDWGIKTSVQILTQGRINPVEIFQYEPEPNATFYDWLYGALTGLNTVYVFHADDVAIFPRYAAFKSLADKLDKKPVLEQTITQRDGRPIFLIYSVK